MICCSEINDDAIARSVGVIGIEKLSHCQAVCGAYLDEIVTSAGHVEVCYCVRASTNLEDKRVCRRATSEKIVPRPTINSVLSTGAVNGVSTGSTCERVCKAASRERKSLG